MYQNIFDSHAHYNGKDFEDRDELLPRLFSSGVCGIIDVASSMRSTRRTVELSARYDMVYSAIGVHPNDNTATIWLATADLISLLKKHGSRVQMISFPE